MVGSLMLMCGLYEHSLYDFKWTPSCLFWIVEQIIWYVSKKIIIDAVAEIVR